MKNRSFAVDAMISLGVIFGGAHFIRFGLRHIRANHENNPAWQMIQPIFILESIIVDFVIFLVLAGAVCGFLYLLISRLYKSKLSKESLRNSEIEHEVSLNYTVNNTKVRSQKNERLPEISLVEPKSFTKELPELSEVKEQPSIELSAEELKGRAIEELLRGY